jgi:hypothetical protein
MTRVACNEAFSKARNGGRAALKQDQKILFIQQLDRRDFALGAMRLSWHKGSRFSPRFDALIRTHFPKAA